MAVARVMLGGMKWRALQDTMAFERWIPRKFA